MLMIFPRGRRGFVMIVLKVVTHVSLAGYISGTSIPLQKQLEHANQQSGFTDAVSEVDAFYVASVIIIEEYSD